MKQTKIQTINAAMNGAKLILGGIDELGAAVHLPHNPRADINEELTSLIMACGQYEQGKQIKAMRRSTLVAAIDDSQKFGRVVRDVLKLVYGNVYSDRWTALGFRNSFAMSDAIEDLIGMLLAMHSHLTKNPHLEVGTLVTAARALEIHDALFAAQAAFMSQEADVRQLMELRDDAFATLRKRISNVFKELSMQLDPMDRRWINFGFKQPGADATPDVPEEVKVTQITPTSAEVKWEAPARAERYRVWMKVRGVDADYVAIGSPTDPDFMLEELPPNATLDFVITALNNGGESPVSEVVTITTS